ncbi:MAG: excinuclease ABC subunit UvrC [Planctomycetes bacterium]|nr:excinuclease ABC subunit UvrC [Planctomycetota bacterium]
MSSSFEFIPKAYPEVPGVYRMISDSGEVLYVGKAKNLRKRLSQYFQSQNDGRYQIDLLITKVVQVETIGTRDEKDALILENQLIKRDKPKYNIRLKDDKTYPYIRLSKDEYPRIEVSRQKGDPQYEYFGPYTQSYMASRLVEFISTRYGLRRCPGVPMKTLEKPCLYAQIGQCCAPCVIGKPVMDYCERLSQARRLLAGHTGGLIREAKENMELASEQMNYEMAAHYRDIWKALQGFEKGTILEGGKHESVDVIACIQQRGWNIISILQVRGGVLWNSDHFQQRSMSLWREELPTFLLEYYSHREVAKLISVDDDFEEREDLIGILRDRSGVPCDIRQPKRGELKSWLSMARQNARAEMSCLEATGELDGTEYLERVQRELDLPKLPKKCIALDAAIFSLEEPVGSVVSFLDGKANKKAYRKFKIKQYAAGSGDVYYIEEILRRYLKRCDEESWPDIILIDGGQLQLDAASKVLLEYTNSQSSCLLALSKGEARKSGDELLHIQGRSQPLSLNELPVSMRLWTEMRDEAHRTVNQFISKRMINKRMLSPFSKIPGIGPKSEKVLREHYGTMRDMLLSEPESVMKVKGLNKNQKEMIKYWIMANAKE